jgi:hypothetical protein
LFSYMHTHASCCLFSLEKTLLQFFFSEAALCRYC